MLKFTNDFEVLKSTISAASKLPVDFTIRFKCKRDLLASNDDLTCKNFIDNGTDWVDGPLGFLGCFDLERHSAFSGLSLVFVCQMLRMLFSLESILLRLIIKVRAPAIYYLHLDVHLVSDQVYFRAYAILIRIFRGL